MNATHAKNNALYWIESIPIKQEYSEDLKSNAWYHYYESTYIPEGLRLRLLLEGLFDTRSARPHKEKGAVVFYKSKSYAIKDAKSLDNEYWTHKVRILRQAKRDCIDKAKNETQTKAKQ